MHAEVSRCELSYLQQQQNKENIEICLEFSMTAAWHLKNVTQTTRFPFF